MGFILEQAREVQALLSANADARIAPDQCRSRICPD